jgi:hypothetical protein
MHFQAAAILLEHGLSPQDFEALAEEFDLLAVDTSVLHDPESVGKDPSHLELVLRGPVVWLPGAVPYANLWRDVRVGCSAKGIQLCSSCFPPNR